MAVNTANYNLKKPSQEDFYNIEDHNGNMDIIDTQIKRVETELEGHLGDTQSHVPHLGTTVNNGNTYTIDSEKTISDGSKFSVKFNAIATGSATLSISSDGLARSLKKPSGEDFKPKAGIYSFIRDGENFQLLGGDGTDYVRQPYSGRVDSDSTSTEYKVTLNPLLIAYEDGLPITIIPNVDCAESPTLNICGLGATPLLDAEGVAVTAGAMKANKPYSFVRVGSNFFIRSGSGGKPLQVNYTGSCKIVAETATKGYIECYSSGTFSFSDRLPQTVDVFLVGGGGGGSSSGNSYVGGGGGAGGYTKTFYKVKPSTPVTISVGAGGTSDSSGGSSTYTGLTSASGGGGATSSNGANGGSAGGGGMILSPSTWAGQGKAGSNGGNGTPVEYYKGSSGAAYNGTGQGTPTMDFWGRIHAGGGAGGAGGNTSTGVGTPGDPGTSSFAAGSGSAGQTGSVGVMGCSGGYGGGGYGGGGGGGGYGSSTRGNGGNGGSGIVIVRWGY